MSLLFNMLSSLVIAFLPKEQVSFNSWLQSSSAVILEPKKIKSFTVSIVFPSTCHEVMGLDATIFVYDPPPDGTFVTTTEPALTPLHHPESIVT